jgi:hypothetical protein
LFTDFADGGDYADRLGGYRATVSHRVLGVQLGVIATHLDAPLEPRLQSTIAQQCCPVVQSRRCCKSVSLRKLWASDARIDFSSASGSLGDSVDW